MTKRASAAISRCSPALAVLIENYLDALARLTPGDSFAYLDLAVRQREINDICRTFPTWHALKVWFEEPGRIAR